MVGLVTFFGMTGSVVQHGLPAEQDERRPVPSMEVWQRRRTGSGDVGDIAQDEAADDVDVAVGFPD